MQGGNRPICKYGEKCHKFQTGSCNFYHPPNQQQPQQQPQQPQSNNFKPLCKNGENCRKFQSGTCNFYHPQGQVQQPFNQQQPLGFNNQRQAGFNESGGFQQSGFKSFGHHQNKSPEEVGGGFKGKSSSDALFTLCRNYHFNQQCQYGDTCKKKHYFIFNDQNAIRRLHFLRNAPSALQSKLTKFRSGQKDYFALRDGNVINFFDFELSTKALNHVFTWNLPELGSGLKYNYYDHKGDYLYYSFPNTQTMLEDMAVLHVPTQKLIHVPNSHSGRLTGMQHFNENVLLTTSMAGELKVWVREGETLVQQPEYTEKLRMCFNPQNLKLELLFLDVGEISGTKCVSAGTNDGRLLFFIGSELSFNQVVFTGDIYSKVYGIRYTAIPGTPPVPCAVVLLWNAQQTLTTLMQLNLNTFQQALLLQSQGQDSRTNMCFFEFVDSLLMVGTLGGELSIYRYPDTSERIGAILHQNSVADIVLSEEELKNTGTKIKYMLVLERKTDKREGSLGFYILK